MKFEREFTLLCPVCLLGFASTTQAAESNGRLFEPGRAWLERYDPTLISSRYFSEFIFESFDGDGDVYKNFISGVILIFERPFKVGDTVEVEGVTGSIRSIGMRASIITQGNGIDTIIPNSNLLENQVTNWTLSDTLLRHSLTVGVDYSSPTREVWHALLAVVAEHGLVLKDPAPEVRFEDFGDKALVFRLLFWFDTRKTTCDTLTSDLRYMIAKSFGEAGLIISSPQQDFKIHPESSLRVRLTKETQANP
jgi:small-conductance mechanosensitive channel